MIESLVAWESSGFEQAKVLFVSGFIVSFIVVDSSRVCWTDHIKWRKRGTCSLYWNDWVILRVLCCLLQRSEHECKMNQNRLFVSNELRVKCGCSVYFGSQTIKVEWLIIFRFCNWAANQRKKVNAGWKEWKKVPFFFHFYHCYGYFFKCNATLIVRVRLRFWELGRRLTEYPKWMLRFKEKKYTRKKNKNKIAFQGKKNTPGKKTKIRCLCNIAECVNDYWKIRRKMKKS